MTCKLSHDLKIQYLALKLLRMALMKGMFQLHPDVLKAADRVTSFCALSFLSEAVLVSSIM